MSLEKQHIATLTPPGNLDEIMFFPVMKQTQTLGEHWVPERAVKASERSGIKHKKGGREPE